jgi:hypothetical protein
MADTLPTRASVAEEARVYGASLPVNPYSALLNEVQNRAGHVAYLREAIQSLPDPNMMFAFDHNGNVVEGALLRRYDKERDRFDRACKLAIDAGIAERYVQLAELHGQALFAVLNAAFQDPDVGLTDGQRAALGPALKRALASEEQRLAIDVEPR